MDFVYTYDYFINIECVNNYISLDYLTFVSTDILESVTDALLPNTLQDTTYDSKTITGQHILNADNNSGNGSSMEVYSQSDNGSRMEEDTRSEGSEDTSPYIKEEGPEAYKRHTYVESLERSKIHISSHAGDINEETYSDEDAKNFMEFIGSYGERLQNSNDNEQ